jgi:acetylornithine deacetylase/succinyl-diaminopimelate desuccinylase-like protein
MSKLQKYQKYISPERLRDQLWQLVQVPSPTGHEKQAAFLFAEMLKKAGATVTIDETLPNSPNVIGRLKGSEPGPVIQLAGHLDHINIPHPAPKLEKDRISGRGAADMKNGLAGILEIIQILHETGCSFPGEILVTAYGLHEAPDGDSRGLLNLLEKGVKGDCAIVFEGPDDAAAIMANGMAIWDLKISHKNPVCHELCTQQDKFELLDAANHCVNLLKQKNLLSKEQPNPYAMLPAESVFVGQLHYGDFYNRLTNGCVLQGTRRWHPDKTHDTVKQEFEALLDSLGFPTEISTELDWFFVGESYEISPDEKIVKCLSQAYETVYGRQLVVRGHSSVTDACRLVNNGHIPAVLCGFGTETGHADFEYVKTEQLVTSCRTALLTVLYYLQNT